MLFGVSFVSSATARKNLRGLSPDKEEGGHREIGNRAMAMSIKRTGSVRVAATGEDEHLRIEPTTHSPLECTRHPPRDI